jgi:hypothetical protein
MDALLRRRMQPLPYKPIEDRKMGLDKGYTLEGLVLEIDGQPHIGYDGWLESMKVSPWYLQGFYALRKLAPFRYVAKIGYGIVAKYRLKWFGTRTCQIPQPKS